MERLTKWNESSYKHAYYPRCFKEPCYGGGCKIKDCPFEIAVCERLAAYEDTGLTPKEVTALGELFDYALKESKTLTEQLTLLHHIRELAEADKDGRLVVLPCKVGDTVWVTRNPWTGKLLKKPLDAYVNGMKMYSHGLYVNLLFDTRKINGTRDYEINHIGKTVFLTHEEAEKALEAMKDDWIETLPVLRRRSNT
jgi:hypothetical protein